jgi:hypothetical protein
VQATEVLSRPTLRPVHQPGRTSTLGQLAIAGLVANAALLLVMMAAVLGEFIPPVAVFAVVGLVFAGLIATGWRWTPIPPSGTGVAIFKPTQAGTYTFYCQPHYDKATGQGMHGTLVVDP